MTKDLESVCIEKEFIKKINPKYLKKKQEEQTFRYRFRRTKEGFNGSRMCIKRVHWLLRVSLMYSRAPGSPKFI